jgi:4-hydroxy 2-oxovalerate aldolase
MTIKELDCTFRDGGYYCDWNFHPTLIKKYLEAMESARVDIVEIGFRFMPKSRLLGSLACMRRNIWSNYSGMSSRES